MRDRARHGVALGTSVLVHGAIFGYAFINIFPDIEMPEIEFEMVEVDLVDPDAIEAENAPEPEPEPPVLEPQLPPEGLPEPETPEEGDSDEPPPEEEGSKRDLGKRRTTVEKLAPPSAKVYMFAVPKKVRKLPYAQSVVDLVAPFPDFEFLVFDGGFDPLYDFDHIVIASSNLTSVQATFLAVDYTMSRANVQAGINRAAAANGESIDWIEENGTLRGNPKPIDPAVKDRDPRFFVLLEEKVAMYIQPKYLPAVISGEDTGTDTGANFVANLSRLKRFARRIPAAGFQGKATVPARFRKNVKGLAFPPPIELEVVAEAATDPEMRIRMKFDSGVDALAAYQFLTVELDKIIKGNALMNMQVGGLYRGIEFEKSGKEVWARAELEAKQTEQMLKLMASQMNNMQTRVSKGREPKDLEAMRQRRLDNWEKREGGALPPSALGEIEPPAAPSEPSAPSLGSTAPPAEMRRQRDNAP